MREKNILKDGKQDQSPGVKVLMMFLIILENIYLKNTIILVKNVDGVR